MGVRHLPSLFGIIIFNIKMLKMLKIKLSEQDGKNKTDNKME